MSKEIYRTLRKIWPWPCLGQNSPQLFIFIKNEKNKMIKNLLLLLSLIVAQDVLSQTVFSVDYESRADVKVFVVDYESRADLLVYKVDYESRAGKNDGNWFFVDYASRADKKVFFVEYESRADLKVFFVEYESRAGWKNSSKKHLLY